MSLYVQGHRLDLFYTDAVRPTVFSLFLGNGLDLDGTEALACDLGTGSGILAIALALKGVERVVAIDCSEVACEVALENVRRNGVAGQVEVVHGDLPALGSSPDFDLVVSNPPTMPDRPGTPGFAAGGGGASGLSFVHSIADGLAGWLAQEGRAQLAISSLVAEEALDSLRSAGFLTQPRATLLAPFRDFYAAAYAPDQLERFVAEGRALREGESAGSWLSELITVYTLRRDGAPPS
jgi:methylase of polypeptide subunit release factors